MPHEHDPKKYLEATIDHSFASAKWQRTVMVWRKRKSWYIRQHLETCVFSYTEVAAEVDRNRPQNHELIINEKGEPALKSKK